MAISRKPEGADVDGENKENSAARQKVVVVGLGMVGVAFVYVFPSPGSLSHNH
jgi:hypothetical protein